MTTEQKIELLEAQIKDRDETIELFLKQQPTSYVKGYYAGANRASNRLQWHYRERERLKALLRKAGVDPVASCACGR